MGDEPALTTELTRPTYELWMVERIWAIEIAALEESSA
jgi:hypothetical protein